MNKDNENSSGPTFEQLPAMLADLSRKFDAFVKRPEETQVATPMGVTICAEFLTAIEGRKVTNGAVYNRVHKGMLPYRKIGAHLFFVREEILDYIHKAKKHHLIITAKELSSTRH